GGAAWVGGGGGGRRGRAGGWARMGGGDRRGPGGRDDPGPTAERTPAAGPSPTAGPLNGGVPWIRVSWRCPPRATPDRWLSVTVTSASTRSVSRGRGVAPSASGSGAVCRGCTNSSRGRGLRWPRSTDADGEGDVRGLPGHGICTGPLDFPPLIDGFVFSRRGPGRCAGILGSFFPIGHRPPTTGHRPPAWDRRP